MVSLCGPVKITSNDNICKLGVDLNNRFYTGTPVGWHMVTQVTASQYFSCHLYNTSHVTSFLLTPYHPSHVLDGATGERIPKNHCSHLSLLPSYDIIKLRPGNPAAKKVNSSSPGMESQSLRADPASLDGQLSTSCPKYESLLGILQT